MSTEAATVPPLMLRLRRIAEEHGFTATVLDPDRRSGTWCVAVEIPTIEQDGSEGSETFYARTMGELRGVLGY